MLDQDTINQQFALLAAHRRTLAHLLEQAAAYGGTVLAPPQTAAGIEEARAEIGRIKMALCEGGVTVEHKPNDEAPPEAQPVQRTGGDLVAGDKVGGDKVVGNKRTIDTHGDDYAEGNIDKRQGNFISGGTVQGPVITDNQGTVNVNYNYQQRPDQALHQLRAPVGDFVGREQEIEQLVQALSKAANNGAAAAISGVRGMGGIGKTELAYVVANRLKDIFHHAQLVVELRGASSSPMTPEQALQMIISSFERETKLPDDLAQLQMIYRAKLSDKRILILVDDAKDIGQVRPLMPPPGCALLVTSRNRFSLPGAMTLNLGTLSLKEAEQLLLEICPRIGKHAGDLAKLCGYLPLALRVSASLLETNDTRDVTHYLEQLRKERLKHLKDSENPDDPQASVEASLKLSFDAIDQPSQTALFIAAFYLYDLLLRVMQTGLEGQAVKARFGPSNIHTTAMVEQLRRRSLVESDHHGYYLHDLVLENTIDRLLSLPDKQKRRLAQNLGVVPLELKVDE